MADSDALPRRVVVFVDTEENATRRRRCTGMATSEIGGEAAGRARLDATPPSLREMIVRAIVYAAIVLLLALITAFANEWVHHYMLHHTFTIM